MVAYSAGGIATRWYLSGQSNPQVNKVITLHSPHGGSFIAGVAFIVHDGAILCTALAAITGALTLIPVIGADFIDDFVTYTICATS